jgi:hypothetical protein
VRGRVPGRARGRAPGLEEDLALWEAGLLSLEEVEARHPEDDVRGLVELWARLQAEGRRPAPDPEPGWAALEPLLEPRGAVMSPWRRGTVRRTLVLVAAAVLGLGAVAYAAGPEGLRREVNGAVVRIVDVLRPGGGRGPSPSAPSGEDRSGPGGRGEDDRGGRGEDEGEDEGEGPSDRSGPGGGEAEDREDRSGAGRGEEDRAEREEREDSSGPGSGGAGESTGTGEETAEPEDSSGPGSGSDAPDSSGPSGED